MKTILPCPIAALTLGVAAVCFGGVRAYADAALTRIAPVGAKSPDSAGKTSPSYVINGSGLNATTGGHDTSNGNNSSVWASAAKPSWFVVDLGEICSVAQIKFWNYNGSKNTNRGLRQIDILFAVDEASYATIDFADGNWFEVVTDLELDKAPGTEGWTGNDPIALDAPKSARYVGIRIDSTWGATQGGLSEIRFDVVPHDLTVSLDSLSFDGADSASIGGALSSTGGDPAEVFLAYGPCDMVHGLVEWTQSVSCGEQTPNVPFTQTLTDLPADQSCFAAFYVLNQGVAPAWSATTNFITGAVSLTMPADFYESETTVRHIVFSRPAACARGALEVAYTVSGDAAADYADQLSGTVVIPDGAIAATVGFTPVLDAEGTTDRTLTVTVQPGLYRTDATSAGSVIVLDAGSVTASNPSWTGAAGTMDWDSPGNWSTLMVPNYLDTVTIDAGCTAEAPVISSAFDRGISKLLLGNDIGSYGALQLTPPFESIQLHLAAGMSVGVRGEGRLLMDDDAKIISKNERNADIKLGVESGSIGTMILGENADSFSGWKFVVGDSGRGEVTINGGSVSTYSNTSGDFILGSAASGEGVLTMNGGTLAVAHGFIVGNSGRGVYTNLAGTVTGYKESCFAGKAGSTAEVVMKGGKLSLSSAEVVIGGGGSCRADIFAGGEMHGRGVRLGRDSGSVGILTVHEGGVLSSSENYAIYAGANGTGILRLLGGRVVNTSSSNTLVVRDSSSAYGLLVGWGSFTMNSSKGSFLRNNGLVIADGTGDDGVAAERSLTINEQINPFQNTIENDSTNGWYAVNKGMLSLAHPSFSLAVGETGVCTWGEEESDAEIDLVNSARLTFHDITTAISKVTGKLYAADRSDVPTLPCELEAAGAWTFDVNGAYASVDVEFRYDHVKAPHGVRLYQLDEDGVKWTRLDCELLSGYRVRASATSASRMFAAVPSEPGVLVIIR